jgi:mRNA interferase MazF
MAAKIRPCLVISTSIADEDRALVTLVPHTTSTRDTRFEAAVDVGFLRSGAFDAQGLVTVPPTRAVRLLGKLKDDHLHVVEQALRLWLRLP